MRHVPYRRGKQGWLVLELLLTTSIAVLVMSAGGIAMFQVMGVGGGLFPTNQLQEEQLTQMLLEIERDFATANRAYVFNDNITESGGPLTHVYAGVNVTNAGGDYCNIWNNSILPISDSAFLANWEANNTAVTGNGAIAATANDSTHQYYTLLILGGESTAAGVNYSVPVISSVIYLTNTIANGGMTYTLTRYENNGTQLVAGQTFKYFAPDVTSFAGASDQSATTGVFPSITRANNGLGTNYNAIVIRFPTAFSTALRDIETGNQARRVKETADAWGLWTFAPENGSSVATTGKWY